MAATVLFCILIFLLSIATEPISCEMNGSVALHNENLTNIARRPSNGTSYRCSRYLYQVEQELKSVIPPLDSLTDNYHSIYNALYPSNNLPSLYVKVILQFLLDYNNGTKIIDKSLTKKMTWSESCAFVSVDHIGLDLVSFFSLGTILPQRRQAELTLTLSPVCKDTKLQNNKNLWRDVLSKLQDIAVIANVSDPRLNTVQCVVYGQEGIKTMENPFPSGIRTILAWNYYWWILGTSFLASFAISFYLNNLINDYYSTVTNAGNDQGTVRSGQGTARDTEQGIPDSDQETANDDQTGMPLVSLQNGAQNTRAHSENSQGTVESQRVKKKKLIIGVTFKMMWFISVLFTLTSTVVSSYLCIRLSHGEVGHILYYVVHIVLFGIFLLVGIVCYVVRFKNCRYKDCYRHAFAFLFPNVYQVVHHFMWVLCGIILEPYWATPIFLLEILVAISLVYVVYLYQRDVVEKERYFECYEKCCIIIHLLLFLISFWAMLFVTAVVGHGQIVNVPAAGVIEVIATAIFIWIVKKAGLKLPVKE